MSFKKLTAASITDLIGDELLDTLQEILPVLDPNATPEQLDRKENLIRILFSFFDAKDFSDKEVLEEFLIHQSETELVKFFSLIGRTPPDSFEEKIAVLLRKGWKDPDYCRTFCAHFSLPETFIPVRGRKDPNFEILNPATTLFKPLKDYQQDIFFRAQEKLDILSSRFIIQMPTGSGKTRTAMELVASQLSTCSPSTVIIWIVNSEELCEQAVESFLELWQHLGTRPIQLVRAWGSNGLIKTHDDMPTFAVCGFQKLYAQIRNERHVFEAMSDRVHMIIVDEAHRVLAPTYSEVIYNLKTTTTRVIGLTATPGRGIDNDAETRRLSDFFHGEKLDVTTPSEDITVFEYFREKGILANGHFQPLVTSPSFELSRADLRHLERNFDFPPSFLRMLGDDNTRNIEILTRLKQLLTNHSKALFFGCSVEHSRFTASTLNFLGISAAHIDGGTPKGTRQAILEKFRNGELQVICNYGILSTGFDAPKVDLVFIARPTRSIILYSQMIGRGLRGPAVGGTESCTVVTVKDNIIGLPDEDTMFTYFDDYFNT